MTRASAHATHMVELGGLAQQCVMPAFAYSTYSLTLALAAHGEVDGWDVDVIAEDHHMFCKCFFAAIWEQVNNKSAADKGGMKPTDSITRDIVPKMEIHA